MNSKISMLSAIEWQALRKRMVDPRDRALFSLTLGHGLLAIEIATLRRSDVHLSTRRIDLRRRGPDGRDVPLLPQEIRDLRVWLRIHGRPDGPLFPSRRDRPISRRQLDRLFKQYCSEVGIAPARAHLRILRKTCAIRMVPTADEWLLLDWLGLRDIRSARFYIRYCQSIPEPTGTQKCG
jgi:integrase